MAYNPRSTSSRFGTGLFAALGIIYCLLGSVGIILSIIELFHGRPSVYHYNENQGGLKIENPLWPSSGKGFWVGLIFIATGLVGILAAREWTPPAMTGFTVLAGVSTILSLYLIITCIIPIQDNTRDSDTLAIRWRLVETAINSILIAVGAFGIFTGGISSIVGCYFAKWCTNHRKQYPFGDVEPNRYIILPRLNS